MDEIKEEVNLFYSAVKKAALAAFIVLILLMVLCFTSCVRYKTITKHTRDTTYIVKLDTQKVKPADPEAPKKVKDSIRTVFVEIEKDCPNIKDRLPDYERRIQNQCTHESLSGGSIKVYSPQLKDSVIIEFDRNDGTAYFKGLDTLIEDKTETTETREESALSKALDLFWLFALVAALFWIIGKFT